MDSTHSRAKSCSCRTFPAPGPLVLEVLQVWRVGSLLVAWISFALHRLGTQSICRPGPPGLVCEEEELALSG